MRKPTAALHIIDLIDAEISRADPATFGNSGDVRTGFGNLIWMIETLRENILAWPGDKCGRWAGFVIGVLEDSGHPIKVPETDEDYAATRNVMEAHLDLLTRYSGMSENQTDVASLCLRAAALARGDGPFELGLKLGRIQGILCARGVTTADSEREVSRPVLHAAYAADRIAIPETTQKDPGDLGSP